MDRDKDFMGGLLVGLLLGMLAGAFLGYFGTKKQDDLQLHKIGYCRVETEHEEGFYPCPR